MLWQGVIHTKPCHTSSRKIGHAAEENAVKTAADQIVIWTIAALLGDSIDEPAILADLRKVAKAKAVATEVAIR